MDTNNNPNDEISINRHALNRLKEIIKDLKCCADTLINNIDSANTLIQRQHKESIGKY